MRFAFITIPVAPARDLALKSDFRTAMDTGYAVKTALAEGYGPGTIRPWRLLSTDDSVHTVLGAIEPTEDLSPNARSRALGLVADIIDHEPDESSITIDIMATPVKRVTYRDRDAGKRLGAQFIDVASYRDPDGFRRHVKFQGEKRQAAYTQWLIEQIESADTGLVPIDVPDVLNTAPHRQVRKVGADPKVILTPRVHATMRVSISDPEAFARFVRRGLKKLKDVGLGAVIPVSVLEQVQA